MNKALSFLNKIYESINSGVITEAEKKMKIVDGKKKQVITKNKPQVTKPEGYKTNAQTGKSEHMGLKERRDRSISATKAANKSSTKRNKKISTDRRKSLVAKGE